MEIPQRAHPNRFLERKSTTPYTQDPICLGHEVDSLLQKGYLPCETRFSFKKERVSGVGGFVFSSTSSKPSLVVWVGVLGA